MKELEHLCSNIKSKYPLKIRDTSRPVKFWKEKDVLNNKVTDSFVIIFRTKGCSWSINSGCTMCGYFNDCAKVEVSDEDLLNQFNLAYEKYNGEIIVKIFNSGSFLDDNEISPKIRLNILKKISETADKISIESRPEYITDKKIKDIKKIIGSTIFEIGVGLETSNDFVREYSLNKGFNFSEYEKAIDILKLNEFRIKTYVLIKPPFLTEKESIKDCIQTVKDIKDLTDMISFNPTNVQRNTLVEYLWKRKQYRPAWLWSVRDILVESKRIIGDKIIKCDIVGGGSFRGAHNCGKCDQVFLDSISNFSLYQNCNVFKDLYCDCYENWQDQLNLENLGYGSLVDIYGYNL